MIHPTAFIHSKAHVDTDVEIGANTKIWQFASITRGTILGKNCSVSPFAMLDGSIYGNGVIISGGVKAGAGFSVGDDVFLGPNVVLCNDCWPYASKQGYDDVALRSGEKFAIIIEDGAAIGANATILPGIRIGKQSVIAAGITVKEDVPNYTLLRSDGTFKHMNLIDWRNRRMRWAT